MCLWVECNAVLGAEAALLLLHHINYRKHSFNTVGGELSWLISLAAYRLLAWVKQAVRIEHGGGGSLTWLRAEGEPWSLLSVHTCSTTTEEITRCRQTSSERTATLFISFLKVNTLYDAAKAKHRYRAGHRWWTNSLLRFMMLFSTVVAQSLDIWEEKVSKVTGFWQMSSHMWSSTSNCCQGINK